ncbi:hypothetical protein COCNU_12G003610 [Cocos nucifera]|uniref:Uncharacterized protein n=1 Tax=Cocos nucifera TaxID=13894 RepID=A0A8K0NAJ8_COCNU|nr:hypothetical protein COCNU_12G003610 [Cocos nucifera]
MASDIEGGEVPGEAPATQIATFDGVGGTGEGGMNVPAAGFLPKMLFYEGSSVVTFGIGALIKPPKGLPSDGLRPLAYYPSVVVLNLFGMWLVKLSFMVAENPDRRTLAKAVMWATLAPMLVVIGFHVLATN